MAARRPSTIPAGPPDRLGETASEVWREVIARGAISPKADAAMLEIYCVIVAQSRDVAAKLSTEGLVVADEKRGAIVHPALAAARQLADQLKDWAPMFNAPKAAVRRRGPMYDATKHSIAAEPKLADDERFKAACEAVLTLAWLIDEAQREGLDSLRQASYVMIPSYLKGCAALQITPASLPPDAKKVTGGGKVRKFEDAARARQALAG
ncbi:P27 family phage terminase small subunit [Microbacterium sp. LjRoot45]|uniref:P27 family phage terminase small subunit n=1 Tax=Microbacterium sp. LjRoot45 TaxID=3342329 RepID=UPI003ECEA970